MAFEKKQNLTQNWNWNLKKTLAVPHLHKTKRGGQYQFEEHNRTKKGAKEQRSKSNKTRKGPRIN